MSGSMEKLTAALEANTAALNKMVEMSGGKPASGGTSAAAKKTTTTKKTTTKKATSVDDIASAFGAYLGVKDADTRNERKVQVKAIVDYFGAAKATEIPAESFDEALGYLQQYIDGETPDFDGGEGGDDDEALV